MGRLFLDWCAPVKENSCYLAPARLAMRGRFGGGLNGWPAGMRQRETRHYRTKNAMRGGTISGYPLGPSECQRTVKELPSDCQGDFR